LLGCVTAGLSPTADLTLAWIYSYSQKLPPDKLFQTWFLSPFSCSSQFLCLLFSHVKKTKQSYSITCTASLLLAFQRQALCLILLALPVWPISRQLLNECRSKYPNPTLAFSNVVSDFRCPTENIEQNTDRGSRILPFGYIKAST
jgi:hypothetical protein